jgi:hypothetical protein
MKDNPVIWIARDLDDSLAAYCSKPYRDDAFFHTTDRDGYTLQLNVDWFPEVTWENSPQGVKLVSEKWLGVQGSLKKKYPDIDIKTVAANGRAAFYATMWGDLRQAAMNCGWALGLHGSLASDMDIMAMPWTNTATSADYMIKQLIGCFGFSAFWIENQMQVDRIGKPNGRVVYTIPIYADFLLDINVIEHENDTNTKRE